jgi:hypothetical protein
MFPTYRLDERSMFFPGAGKVQSSEYESVSVQLKKELTSEAGTITVTAPGGIAAGQELLVDVVFTRIINSYLQEFACDLMDTIKIVMPSPLPSSPANWIASYIRSHPAFASSCTATVATNVITYRVIRPGVTLSITSATANLVVRAVTTGAANGLMSNIGDGAAIFYRPLDNTMNPAIKALFGYLGFSSATPSPLPLFMGVRRAHDKIQNLTNPSLVASPLKEDCCEVVRRGVIHVPLETPASSIPATNLIGITARFAVDGAFTRVGGYRIVDNTAALPVGTMLVPRSEVLAVASDRRSALIRLI